MVDVKNADITRALHEAIVQGSASPVSEIAKSFSVSRQAVHKHLDQLVKDGLVRKHGSGRSMKYIASQILQSFDLTKDRDEHEMWRVFEPSFEAYPKNVYEILIHGFTEMANNAIEHSSGSNLKILLQIEPNKIVLSFTDNGIGIFKKIQKDANLVDERLSLLELSKGKFTSDPTNHSGEGIFFTSRMFDQFSIFSGELAFSIAKESSVLIDVDIDQKGTMIVMTLQLPSTRTAREVFRAFSSSDGDHRFSKTIVPLKLASLSDRDLLVSRSQAKRVMARVDNFDSVVLDFDRVESVGQAFADEIFRVYTLTHSSVQVIPINMNSDVERMVLRALEPPKNKT